MWLKNIFHVFKTIYLDTPTPQILAQLAMIHSQQTVSWIKCITGMPSNSCIIIHHRSSGS